MQITLSSDKEVLSQESAITDPISQNIPMEQCSLRILKPYVGQNSSSRRRTEAIKKRTEVFEKGTDTSQRNEQDNACRNEKSSGSEIVFFT